MIVEPVQSKTKIAWKKAQMKIFDKPNLANDSGSESSSSEVVQPKRIYRKNLNKPSRIRNKRT